MYPHFQENSIRNKQFCISSLRNNDFLYVARLHVFLNHLLKACRISSHEAIHYLTLFDEDKGWHSADTVLGGSFRICIYIYLDKDNIRGILTHFLKLRKRGTKRLIRTWAQAVEPSSITLFGLPEGQSSCKDHTFRIKIKIKALKKSKSLNPKRKKHDVMPPGRFLKTYQDAVKSITTNKLWVAAYKTRASTSSTVSGSCNSPPRTLSALVAASPRFELAGIPKTLLPLPAPEEAHVVAGVGVPLATASNKAAKAI
jgi:hypothetical protein